MKYDPACKPIISGLLEIFILSRAHRGEFSGKIICEELNTITNSRWKPSPGTIYPLLARLVKDGLIKASKNSNGREVTYIITPLGSKAFESKKTALAIHGDESMSIMLPVFISILQNLSPNEAVEIARDMSILKVLRDKLFLMPKNERRTIINKISKLID